MNTSQRKAMEAALHQLCLTGENLRKGMSKSVQKLQARENLEAIAALRTELDATIDEVIAAEAAKGETK